jgi:integrase
MDSMGLVEVAAVIEEQQAWLREQYPGFPQRFLFVQRVGNRRGNKPYAPGSYNAILRELSDIARFTDSKNRPVQLSHTHRFRHTRLTRLAELGLPVHVLQRYAGHYAGDRCQVDPEWFRYRRAAAAGERFSSWPISAQVWP